MPKGCAKSGRRLLRVHAADAQRLLHGLHALQPLLHRRDLHAQIADCSVPHGTWMPEVLYPKCAAEPPAIEVAAPGTLEPSCPFPVDVPDYSALHFRYLDGIVG